jgi:hypothetical protein
LSVLREEIASVKSSFVNVVSVSIIISEKKCLQLPHSKLIEWFTVLHLGQVFLFINWVITHPLSNYRSNEKSTHHQKRSCNIHNSAAVKQLFS